MRESDLILSEGKGGKKENKMKGDCVVLCQWKQTEKLTDDGRAFVSHSC